MADDFTRLEFAWLDQVAADADLPAFAARVAIILLRYYGRIERAAWPSMATLARDLGATERSIQRALQTMTPKHLTIIAGGGRSATNRYRWNISAPGAPGKPRQMRQGLSRAETPTELSPFRPRKPRQNCQGIETETPTKLTRNPDNFCRETPTELSPEPTEENLLKEPTESISIESEVCDPGKIGSKTRPQNARKKAKPKASDATFEGWWKQYPRRVAKGAAEKAYSRIVGSGEASVAELMAGALRYAAERTGQDPQFTKHPSTWLAGACWADEPQAPAQPRKVTPVNRQANGGGMSAVAGIFGDGIPEDDF
jgi:Helix-turn-helix domain